MDLTTWLSTIAALGAFLAAGFAAFTSAQLTRIERGRDAAEAAMRRQAGASNVIAWSAVHFLNGERLPNGLIIRNGDSAPIFDIVVASMTRGATSPPLRMALLPPGEYFVSENPTYRWDYAKSTDLVQGSLRPVTKHATWRVTEMLFTDAAGHRWRRDDRGRLETLGDGDPPPSPSQQAVT